MPPKKSAARGRILTLLTVTGALFCAAAPIASATIVRPAEGQVVRDGKVKLVVKSSGGRPA